MNHFDDPTPDEVGQGGHGELGVNWKINCSLICSK